MTAATVGAALSAGGGAAHLAFSGLRLVKDDENDILRIVHRECGKKRVEPLVAE